MSKRFDVRTRRSRGSQRAPRASQPKKDWYGQCETCEHFKFDEQWGEMKCTKVQHRIYPEKPFQCPLDKEK